MNVYELSQETEKAFSGYLSCFDPDTGEQTATDEEVATKYAELKELENRKDELVEWALKKRANALSNCAAAKAEIDRIAQLGEREGKTASRMEKLIGLFFPADKTPKPVILGNFQVSYRASSAVEILDASKLPKKFIVKKVTTSPDKTAISAAIKAGKKVPGARIEERQNIQIK